MRRNASLTTQQRYTANRPYLRRTPSNTGVSQRRPLTRPGVVPPIRTTSLTDPSPSMREFEQLEHQAQEQTEFDEIKKHDEKVIETLEFIHEAVKGSVDASCKGQSGIVEIIKEIKDSIDIIKSHTPRKNPECEAEMRDLLVDIKDELKGLRSDVCAKGNDTINAVTDLKGNIPSTNTAIPLHRRDSANKVGNDMVNALKDLQSAIETPRGEPSGGYEVKEMTRELKNSHREQMREFTSSIGKVVARLDELLSITKEYQGVYQMRKKQDTILFTEIKDAIEKRAELSSQSSDYEQKYLDVKTNHENQFYKFSKIIAMYHSAMLRLCRSENPEAEEEFRKLSELVGVISDAEREKIE